MSELPSSFKNYFQEIGLSQVLIDEAQKAYTFYNDICQIRSSGVFVSEYVNSDGMREYDSLWFMNDQQCMEVHDFSKNPTYDMSPWFRNIKRWVVKTHDYDFNEFSDTSRFTLEFTFHTDIAGVLKASKENCKYLTEILQNYIVPNTRSD